MTSSDIDVVPAGGSIGLEAHPAAAEADKDDEPAAWSVQSPDAPDKPG